MYKPIIGLEIHVELATKSKMFCGCKNDPFFASDPNIYTCPVCLGLPGGLPVPNKKAIEWCVMLGLSLGCTISSESKFDRKNYFYPDLPKGYQITQYDQPLAYDGTLRVEGKTIRIRRVHMEEDTGKLIHSTVDGKRVSLVDFNRSGVPLVEIVTEPDFRTVEEVDSFLKKLQQIIRYLGISGADMEKGTMRLEPSISLSSDGTLPNYRVELKNINSFRFVRKAIEFEIARQSDSLHEGNPVVQQTRGWDESTGKTVPQREKEEAHDYRYFPEPDIPPIRLDKPFIDSIRSELPELPDAKKEGFMKAYGLNEYDAALLTETIELAKYFERAVFDAKEGVYREKRVIPKEIANWIINRKIDINSVYPAALVHNIVASKIFNVDEANIKIKILNILDGYPDVVADYKSGKEAAINRLFGQVLKSIQGNPDKQVVMRILKECLK